MKNLQLIVLILLTTSLFASIKAQTATNNTDEDWTINYYGATTVVPANTPNVTINMGHDCLDGISVKNGASPACELNNMTPNTYNITCSTETSEIIFVATISTSWPCWDTGTPPDRYDRPDITFNP